MRCHVPTTAWSDPRILLTGGEAHHVLRVLRARVGDHVQLFDGRGRQGEAEIAALARHEVELRLLQTVAHPRPAVEIHLAQALPREQKMDLIVQKAVELELSGIVPLLTEHCVVQLTAAQRAARSERWREIAVNAGKQSGVAWLPEIAPVRDIGEFLAQPPPWDVLFVGSLAPGAIPLPAALATARQKQPRTVGVLIGPEGDFTPGELETAAAAGAVPVTLGASVLRVETAAIYLMSILRFVFHDGFAHQTGT